MGYLCDVTRIFIIGNPAEEIVDAYDKCLRVQEYIASHLVPGTIPSQLFREASAVAESLGLKENFMGYGANQVAFLGHGVGLEVDEWPVLAPRFDDPLEEGTVLAVEPKAYLKGIGGVGIENTFHVTSHGGRRLCGTPDDLIILEQGR